MKRFASLLLLWLLQAGLAIPGRGAIPVCNGCAEYCEDWEGGSSTIADWAPTDVTLSVGSIPYGGSAMQIPLGAGAWGAALYTPSTYSDVTIEVTSPDPQASYILLAVSGGMLDGLWCADCYQIAVNPFFSPVDVTLRKIHGATSSSVDLSSSAGPATFNLQPFRVKAVRTGGLIQVYLDDTLTLSYDDPSPLGSGNVGLQFSQAGGGTSYADRILINPFNCPTATPTPTPTASPTATETATPGPTATITPTATPGLPFSKPESQVDCYPNFVQGGGGSLAIQARAVIGGACSLKVDRGNGRGFAQLWQGALAPGEVLRQSWNTQDAGGAPAPSGVYYVVFTDGDGSTHVQKVLIIR